MRLSEDKILEVWHMRAEGLSLRGVAAMSKLPLAQVQRILEHRTYQHVEVPEDIKVAAEAVNTLQRQRYSDRVDEFMLGRMVSMKRKGYTQTQIAEELGITQPCVHGWLKKIKETA